MNLKPVSTLFEQVGDHKATIRQKVFFSQAAMLETSFS
jgi:hypothetical protein